LIMATSAVPTATYRIPIESPEVRGQALSFAFTLTRWGLLATLMAAPLAFGAVQPWAWAGLLIVSFGLLMLWTIAGVQQREIRVHGSPLYLPAALLLVLCVAQLYGGITLDAYATRESIFKLVMVLVFFFAAGQLFARAPKTVWRELGLAVTLYAFALGLFAILQFFASHNLIYWTVKSDGWTFGPYVNHNDYAGLMEMLIPIAAAYVLSRPRTDPRRLLLASSLPVPVASLLLSGSRGGCVSLLVEVLMLGWVLWRRFNNHYGQSVAMLAIGLTAAALLFFWMAPSSVVKRLEGLADLNRTTDVSLAQRKLAALDTLWIFRDHPWVGIGLGSFDTVFPRYRTFPTDLDWAHAHNDYAEVLAETGLAGGALGIWALAVFFRRAFRDLLNRLRYEAGWMQFGAALGCCGLLVHSFADFNLHIPANAVWFAVCVALATAPVPETAGQGKARSK
jgi:O-antigen ligase